MPNTAPRDGAANDNSQEGSIGLYPKGPTTLLVHKTHNQVRLPGHVTYQVPCHIIQILEIICIWIIG